jgi:mycofactocin precursor peptide peptidase
MSWPDVPPGALLLVPTGSFEQHGPHLPLHTDTTIASAVAARAARLLGEPAFVGPPMAYGSSGEHHGFAGTISIGTAALRDVLVELVRSSSDWAERVVFVNGHGGNLTALRLATPAMRAEGHDVGWVACGISGGDAHAGHVETSLMLYLARDEVDMARAVEGNREPLARLMPALVTSGVRSVSPTGVLGDPREATAATGAALIESIVDGVVARIRFWSPDRDGCLVTAEEPAR